MNRSYPEDNVLLIDDKSADAVLILETLTHPIRGIPKLERLSEGSIEGVLVNLPLPESQGIETLDRVLLTLFGVPLVVQAGLDAEAPAAQSLQGDQIDTHGLLRTLSYPLSCGPNVTAQRITT